MSGRIRCRSVSYSTTPTSSRRGRWLWCSCIAVHWAASPSWGPSVGVDVGRRGASPVRGGWSPSCAVTPGIDRREAVVAWRRLATLHSRRSLAGSARRTTARRSQRRRNLALQGRSRDTEIYPVVGGEQRLALGGHQYGVRSPLRSHLVELSGKFERVCGVTRTFLKVRERIAIWEPNDHR